MGILSAIERRNATAALDDKWYTPGGYFYGGIGGKTRSGAKVSEFSAMQLAVVWCCIKVIAEDIASLPLHLYKRLPNGGKKRAVDHPLYTLLHDQPNPEMTAFSFRESYAQHILSWGNGYAEKVYGRGLVGRNVVEQLWPITPNRVTPKRDDKKQLVYKITLSNGDSPVVLPKRLILHTPGLGFDGITGYSTIAFFRQCIGLGMALEEYAELYFGNGTHPSAIVTHPNQVKDKAAMREALTEVYGGLGNAHRLMLLEDNMKFEKVGIPNDEAQFLESRKYSNVDIGTRIYRLPPQMYGEYDKASTYASAEQFAIDYVTKTLRAWLVRLEQSYNMNLLAPDERREYFWEHNAEGLLRGDAQSRGEFYQKLFAVGGITPNQVAEIENWNPIGPEGDRRFVPLNMIPLEDAGKDVKKPTTAAEKNSFIYRQRLDNAYRRIFQDASDRIVRKEIKAVRRIAEKHANNGISAAFAEFYSEMPEYIEKQIIPACLSYTEAFLGMEEELNGHKITDFKDKIDNFVHRFVEKYASELAERNLREAQNSKNIEKTLAEWEESRAYWLANEQVNRFSEAINGVIR